MSAACHRLSGMVDAMEAADRPHRQSSQRLTRRAALMRAGLALLVLGRPITAQARRGRGRHGGDHDDHGGHEDYERARTAVGAGEALPLSEIVVEVKKVIDGDVLDVELLKTDTDLNYQIRMLARSGVYFRVLVNARTKVILKIEQQ